MNRKARFPVFLALFAMFFVTSYILRKMPMRLEEWVSVWHLVLALLGVTMVLILMRIYLVINTTEVFLIVLFSGVGAGFFTVYPLLLRDYTISVNISIFLFALLTHSLMSMAVLNLLWLFIGHAEA